MMDAQNSTESNNVIFSTVIKCIFILSDASCPTNLDGNFILWITVEEETQASQPCPPGYTGTCNKYFITG